MMNGWGEFFWAVVASSAGSAFLVGVAVYLGRSQISHWLNKDLERTKAQYGRELEAYKVTLIAETERAKAAQSIKTAGALKMIERKFTTLDELSRTTREHATRTVSTCLLSFATPQQRIEHIRELQLHMQKGSEAIEAAAPFLVGQEYMSLLGLTQTVNTALGQLMALNGPPVPEDQFEPIRAQLLAQQANVNSMVQNKILAMMEVA